MAEYQALTGLAVVDFQPLMAFLRERWQKIIQQKEICGRFSYKPPNPVGENAPVGVKYELGVIGHDRETKCGV